MNRIRTEVLFVVIFFVVVVVVGGDVVGFCDYLARIACGGGAKR